MNRLKILLGDREVKVHLARDSLALKVLASSSDSNNRVEVDLAIYLRSSKRCSGGRENSKEASKFRQKGKTSF